MERRLSIGNLQPTQTLHFNEHDQQFHFNEDDQQYHFNVNDRENHFNENDRQNVEQLVQEIVRNARLQEVRNFEGVEYLDRPVEVTVSRTETLRFSFN